MKTASSTQAQRRGPSLRVVCVNDVYTLENLPRLKRLVQHHAEALPADSFIVTLAGDFIAPSILSSLDKGVGMLDCLNAVPITHVTFGNHEDDVGTRELKKRVLEFKGTWINTNMPAFTPALPTHQILEVASPGGRTIRVGLLGLLAHQPSLYQPGAFGGHPIEPVNEAAVRWARRLIQEEGCACVIPITHQDLPDDLELARMAREPRFPIVIAGHDHEVVIEEVDGSWVIKAGANAANAVIVDLVWPAAAPPEGTPDLPVVTVKLEELSVYPEDPAMRARVDGHLKVVRGLDKATLVHLEPGEQLSSVGMKARQTSLGTLLCSRIRDALAADCCFINSGGVRGEHEYQERFTYADLRSALPYANEVGVVRMPGRVIRDAVASSRSLAREDSSGYLQVDDGMIVEGDVVKTIGGAPLDPDREYRIATVLGLLGGMNSIEPIVQFARETPERVPPRDSGREIKIVLVEAFAIELWQHLGSFEDIDADHDGVITPDELKAAISRVTAEAPSEIVLEDMIRVLDADGDHIISRQEAIALVHRQRAHSGDHATSASAARTSREKDGI